MMKHIKWLKYSFSLIIIIIFIVTIFNYKIDSLGIFKNSNYLSNAAKTLTNGEIIAGLKNYDERLFQELIIKNLQVKNDVIAIGSSRIMQLRKQFFLDEKINFFNHSVSGGSLEDYIAIVGVYEFIHGYIPSTIILSIDPWVFNKYNGQTRWKTLMKYYNYEIEKIYNKEQDKLDNIKNGIDISKWKQLFNYDYTISNIKFFKLLSENDNKAFYVTKTINIDDSIKEIDGSIHYPYSIRYIKNDKVQELAKTFSKGNVYSLTKYTTLSNIELFEDFIKYLKSKEINILLVLFPYNPVAYDIFIKNEKYKHVTIAEKYLKDFSIQNSIQLKGSYNPHKYGFESKDFFDGMHSKDGVYEKIMNQKEEVK